MLFEQMLKFILIGVKLGRSSIIFFLDIQLDGDFSSPTFFTEDPNQIRLHFFSNLFLNMAHDFHENGPLLHFLDLL